MTKLPMYGGDNEAPRQEAPREIGSFEALWAFFSSMKTAIALLLVLAVVAIIGTIIEDRTGGPGKEPTRIYDSPWFSFLLILIGVNLLVCSINRFGMVWRWVFSTEPYANPTQVGAMPHTATATASVPVGQSAEAAEQALKAAGYHVTRQGSADAVSLHGQKGRACLWGPHITHFSLLLIFLAGMVGHIFGKEGYTHIEENSKTSGYYPDGKEQPVPLGFDVALKDFTIKYDGARNPIGYKSDLLVFDGGKEAASKVIDVNSPLTYRGMTFYQSDYGMERLVIKLTGPDGKTAEVPYNIGQQMQQGTRFYGIAEDNPLKQVKVGNKSLTLFVHNLVPDFGVPKDSPPGEISADPVKVNQSMLPLNPAVDVMVSDTFPQQKGMDAFRRLGWMTEGQAGEFKGYKVELAQVVRYTGLSVGSNPALPFIYLGFGTMLLGLLLSFYVTLRVIRVNVTPTPEGSSLVLGASSKPEPESVEKDFARLSERLSAA